MKYLAITALVLLFSGCKTETTETQANYQLPEGLQDCKIYDMESQSSQNIIVARCPNSTTTTNYRQQQGKSYVEKRSVVVDGVTYVSESEDAQSNNQSNH